MKKLLLFSVLLILSFPVFAQNFDTSRYGRGKIPFDAEGKAIFTAVVPAEGQTQSDLFKRCINYLSEPSRLIQNLSIQENNPDSCYMIVTGATLPERYRKGSGAIDINTVRYTVKVECRDSRYKISIFNIEVCNELEMFGKKIGGDKPVLTTAEQLTDEKAELALYHSLRMSVIDTATGIMDGMKEYVTRKTYGDNDW